MYNIYNTSLKISSKLIFYISDANDNSIVHLYIIIDKYILLHNIFLNV